MLRKSKKLIAITIAAVLVLASFGSAIMYMFN